MSNMISHCSQNLNEIYKVISGMSDENYSRSLPVLFGASIGQHVRHVLEFYGCLLKGCQSKEVNYDRRKRDYSIETSIKHAQSAIVEIVSSLDKIDINQKVVLSGDMSIDGDSPYSIDSSVLRELAYNLEHSIHHQALIKIGLSELGILEAKNENLGVAPSTIRSN